MKTKQVLSLGISLFLMASPVFSSEEAEENQESLAPIDQVQEQSKQSGALMEQSQEGEHIAVGSEPLSEELQNQMNDEHVEKYQEFKAQSEQGRSYSPKYKASNISCALGSRPPVKLAAYSHSMHVHSIKRVSPDGRFVEIGDGSRWEIATSDVQKVLKWCSYQNCVIFVMPNSGWLTSQVYPYTFTNQQSGSSVRVKLILGPILNGQKSHWVIKSEPSTGTVYLENGTVWKIAKDDSPYFAKWQVNHHVIIGNYYPWFYFFYPYDSLLINVNMDHYVHAKQN